MQTKPKGLPKTGGRQKGSQNKATIAVKDALAQAFNMIGGVDGLAKWAKGNQTEYYKLWVKTLPMEVNAKVASTELSLEDFLNLIDGKSTK